MSFLQSLILGIIQGLTEFLPVSSSAHLVLVPFILNWKIPESQIFPFDVLVQLGTLLAVIIYFWQDLCSILKAFFKALFQGKPFADAEARMGWYLILATIPAGLAGLFLKSKVEAAFNNPRTTAIFLFVTALFLLVSEFFSRRSRKLDEMNWKDASWIGVFQAFSIFPGISRSGSTITGGMTRNFDRPTAARFSFLMSIPVMLAAGVFSILDLLEVPELGSFLPILAVGFIAAAVVGYLSIRWLLSFLNRHSLIYFAAYCILLASTVLIISNVRQNTEQAVTPATPAPLAENTVKTLQELAQIEKILLVDTTSSTQWLLPAISSCAEKTAGVSVVTTSNKASQGETGYETIHIRWGQPESLEGSASVLGQDQLAFIVNPENPIKKLPLVRLQEIASGTIQTWNDLFTDCPNCFSTEPDDALLELPIQLLIYPSAEDALVIFEDLIQPGALLARSSALLVPSPSAVNEVVLANLNAFGFLPGKAVDPSARLVKVTTTGETVSSSQPILAITETNPQGATREWLACLSEYVSNRP
jgi:undecaprenyl-diphosphatase